MYYSREKKIEPFEINESGIRIVIDPEQTTKRFVLIIKTDTCYFQSITPLLKKIENVNLRKKIKVDIYHKTRQAFYNTEIELPDSTQGVLQFLLGRDYRTCANEGIYTFKLQPLIVGVLWDITKTNIPYELSEHLKAHLTSTWPTRVIASLKTRTKSIEETWLLDPYQLFDIFTNNIKGINKDYRFWDLDRSVIDISIQSYPKQNRLIINTKYGKITQSYLKFQLHILYVIKQTLAFFVIEPEVDAEDEFISAAYILSHWEQAYKLFKDPERHEQNRLMREFKTELLAKGAIPWNKDDLLAGGVQEYYDSYKGEFENSSIRMQSYANAFARLNNISIPQMMTNIKGDPFYCYNEDFKKDFVTNLL